MSHEDKGLVMRAAAVTDGNSVENARVVASTSSSSAPVLKGEIEPDALA